MPLTKAQYQDMQSRVLILAGMIADLPHLDEMLEEIRRAEAIGPILDPTLFMRGSRNMKDIATIAGALRRARSEIREPHARLRSWAEEQLLGQQAEALAE